MKLKGQLQWTDHLNAQLLHMQPAGRFGRIIPYIALVVTGLCLVGGVILSVVSDEFPIELMIPGFIGVAVFAFYRYVLLPWRVKKIFFQQKEFGLPFEMEITDTGLIASNEIGNSNRPWTNFTKWKENKDLFLLYHSDVMFSMIPKRLLTDPEQVITLRTLLERNKVPVAKNRRLVTGCGLCIILIVAAVAMVLMAVRREAMP